MLRNLCAASLLLLFAGDNFTKTAAQADEKEKSKHSIGEVMQKGMKGQLWKKVATGKADAKEQAELVELLEALQQDKPPRGDEKSWKERTAALTAAAKAVVAKEPQAGDKLTKAIDCGSCHRVHKT